MFRTFVRIVPLPHNSKVEATQLKWHASRTTGSASSRHPPFGANPVPKPTAHLQRIQTSCAGSAIETEGQEGGEMETTFLRTLLGCLLQKKKML